MMPADTADDLRAKIENYQRSRKTAVGSLHRWLDAPDAEEKLHALAGGAAAAAEDGATSSSPPPPPPSPRGVVGDSFRSTYPFDENAPRQRIS